MEAFGKGGKDGDSFCVCKFHADILMRHKIAGHIRIRIFAFIEIGIGVRNLPDYLFGQAFGNKIAAENLKLGFH